jgi:hypothetical protein
MADPMPGRPATSNPVPDDLAERLAAEEVAAEIPAERMPAGDSSPTLTGLVGIGQSDESDVSERIDKMIAQRFGA